MDPKGGRKRKASEVEPEEGQPEEVAPKTTQKRGRPRVEARDANAIERRRTQIRVAQRAYRARKDSTIVDLQAQVLQLQQVLNETTVNLQELSDKLIVAPEVDKTSVREDLHETISKLLELKKSVETARNESSSDGDELSPRHGSISTSQSSTVISQSAEATPMYHDSSTNVMLRQSLTGIPGDSTTRDVLQQQWSNPFTITTTQGLMDSLATMSPMTYVHPPLPNRITPTFSWQETTFARRLMRHSHEMCLRHLENPSDQYSLMKHAARYSLSFMTEAALIQKLRLSVAKTTEEPLEDWSMPMLHVGGSGTHFEPIVNEPNIDFRAGQERNVGPFQLPAADIRAPSTFYPDQVAEWLGLEGHWLDHRDVEGYLEQRGVNLEGSPSTTIFEIRGSQFSETVGAGAWPSSDQWSTQTGSPAAGTSYVQYFNRDVDFTSGQQSIPPQLRSRIPEPTMNVRPRRVVLALDRLVERLNERAVCLGRAPGYKQSDVEEAFNNAVRLAPEYTAV